LSTTAKLSRIQQYIPDMELGQWVIWVIFSVWVTGSPGHHYIYIFIHQSW